jgi:YebC/PmpR family DNA-binding regulatory protein
MGGHSHWKGIKEKKGATDKKRGKLFAKLLRGIEIAGRMGDPNPENNPTLWDAIQRAKDASVPKDNIERAIARGAGQLDTEQWESLFYEGYAPGGVAVLVSGLTNNRNRTSQDLRAIFRKHAGNLSEPGSVRWLFERKGVILIPGEGVDEDTLMQAALEAGAEDVVVDSEGDIEVVTDARELAGVQEALKVAGFSWESAEVTERPQNLVKVEADDARKVLRILDALEDHDDVQAVYANYDIPDTVLSEIA